MSTRTPITPMPHATRSRSPLAPCVAALLLAFAAPGVALAGDDGDVSYEDIDHSFVDDYSGGYSWKTTNLVRDGVSGTIKVAHEIRGEPNIWDLNGSFFENTTNRRRYVAKAQEWASADYLGDNAGDVGKVATSFIAYNAGDSENDVLNTWIYVNGVEVRDIAADYVSEELLEGVILSSFTDDVTITFKFKYDPAFTGSKTKSCAVTVHADEAVYARSIAVKIDTGDWWTGDGAGCSVDYNRSWGGEIELRAGWDDEVCLNAVGTNPTANGANVNTYHCGSVAETWRYGSDMKIHAAWDPDMCLNMSGTNLWGGNVNLYDCDYAESFYFGDDDILHLAAEPDYCVNVIQSGIAWNQDPTSQTGADVNIYHCDWVIDAWSVEEM